MARDAESFERFADEVMERLRRLEARVAGLEARAESPDNGSPEPASTTVAASVSTDLEMPIPRPDLAGVLSLCGRTFLVLGGAFLLRALAESGTLAARPGVTLALLYAGLWIAAGERAARRGAVLSASLHGVAGVLVAMPVIVEATVRFQVVSGRGAIGILAVVTAAVSLLALRHRLAALFWTCLAGSVATVGWTFFGAGVHLLSAAFAILIAVAAAVVARTRGWNGPQWLAAGVADLLVFALVQVVRAPDGLPQAYQGLSQVSVAVLAATLTASFLAVVTIATLTGSRVVTAFDMAQVPVALLIGIAGVSTIARETAVGGSIVWGTCVLIGIACYGVAFAVVEGRHGRHRGFFFYTTLGLALVLAGVWLPASRETAAMVWGLFGLILAALGGSYDRISLRAHAAALLGAAVVASGLPAVTMVAFGAKAVPPPGRWLFGIGGGVLIMLVIGYGLLTFLGRRRVSPWYSSVPRLVVLLPTVAVLGAVTVALAARIWPADVAGPSTLAAIRSVVLAALVVVLAVIGRHPALPEAGWLVYPLLAIAGLRLLVVDLRFGSASSLVVAFAAFGASLILAPRLLRGRVTAEAQPKPSERST